MSKKIQSINIKKIWYMFLLISIFFVGIEKLVFYNEAFDLFRVLIEVITASIFLIVLYIIYQRGIEKKLTGSLKRIGINKLFIVVGLVIGIISSILVPLHEIPDELTHINFSYDERGLDIEFSDVNSGYMGSKNIIVNNRNKVKKGTYFDMTKKITVDNKFGIPKVTIIRHFPQIIGMVIGEFLHLPVFIYLTICELFGLIFYIIVCSKALQKMPFKKNLMMFIMLLPVCIQQMASFSYDVMLNSFCFLFIATIMDLKFSKESITFVDLIKLLVYLIIITICKLPYALIGFLVFILPIHKVNIKLGNKKINYASISKMYNKNKIVYNAIGVFSVIVIVYIAYRFLLKIPNGRVLIASIVNFKSTLLLMKRSVEIFFPYYVETIVGNLGIFNIKTSIFFEIYIYVSLFLVCFADYGFTTEKKKTYKFRKRDYVMIYMIVAIFIYVIILSMFIWTLYCTNVPNYEQLSMSELADYIRRLPYIGGVQGRYFIPIIPLILIPISSEKISKKLLRLSPNFYQVTYYVLLCAYFLITMATRFWI